MLHVILIAASFIAGIVFSSVASTDDSNYDSNDDDDYLGITWHRLGISPSVLVLVLYDDSGIYRANTIGGLVLLFYMTILCEKSNNVTTVNKAIDSE